MNIIPSHELVTHRVANSMYHQDSGLIGRYVRMADTPTIDSIPRTDKDEAVARYSILHERKQIFASKYMLYLPSEEELAAHILMERRLIEERETRGK